MTDPLARRLAAPVRAQPTRPADDVLAAAAAAHGLLDVCYTTVDTAVGRLLLAASPSGLLRVAFAGDREDGLLAELAARVSPRILRAPERLAETGRQLAAYLAGERTTFDIALDWRLAGPFQRAVLGETAAVPYGGTTTYGRLAEAVGRPGAARAAGRALATNPLCIVVPCHRVVPAAGGVGGYAGGSAAKRRLLALEGAAVA